MGPQAGNGHAEGVRDMSDAPLALRQELAPSPFEPRSYAEAQVMAKDFADAKLTKARTAAQALLIMATGRDLGISATTALRCIDIIDTGSGDRPSLSADLMVALCQRRTDICRYFIPIESTAESATYITQRVNAPMCEGSDLAATSGRPIETCPKCKARVEVKDAHLAIHQWSDRETFTMEMRRRAKLGLTKDKKDSDESNWSKYPEAMLRHRASSFLARKVYPDILAGFYTEEELREIRPIESVVGEVGPLSPAPVTGPIVPAPATTSATPAGEDAAERLARWERELRQARSDAEADKVKAEILKTLPTGDADRKRLAVLYTDRKATGWAVPPPADDPDAFEDARATGEA